MSDLEKAQHQLNMAKHWPAPRTLRECLAQIQVQAELAATCATLIAKEHGNNSAEAKEDFHKVLNNLFNNFQHTLTQHNESQTQP